MKIPFFLASLFHACMAGYGVHSQNYQLTVFCLAMIFLLCFDSLINELKDKNAN